MSSREATCETFTPWWHERLRTEFAWERQVFVSGRLQIQLLWWSWESELQALSREAEHGRRHVDSLVRVQRGCGTSQLVFIHIEVQSQEDAEFTARMLLYHTRILDRFGHGVCSLAIIGDSQARWRPSSHQNSFWGCSLNFEFPMRKLLDYPDWASSTHNPFAWLTAAHLQALATRRNPRKRAEIKFRLIRGLYLFGPF